MAQNMYDIVSVFERTSARHGDRVFAFDSERAISYASADERTNAVAADLVDRGICDGTTLGLCATDRIALWIAIVGAWKAGALPALIDARTSPDDLSYFVRDVAAPLIVAAPELHDRLAVAGATEVIDIGAMGDKVASRTVNRHDASSPLYLSYTSGTTGQPKGAVLQSGPVTLGTSCIADRLDLSYDDVVLATTPTASSFQLVAAIMPAIHVGASVGLFAGSAIDAIWAHARRESATVLAAYPLTLADMVNAAQANAGACPFRIALSGGSPLAPRIKRDFRQQLRLPLVESYGQSEFGGFMAMGRPDDQEVATAGYVGRPLPDRPAYVGGSTAEELPAGEVGEVLVKSGFFRGYHKNPEKTAETLSGGVLHTGDLAVADPYGNLKVLGRVKEATAAKRRGGFLRELEDAYYEHQGVLHAAVVENAEGTVEAFVELQTECRTPEVEIERFVRSQMPTELVARKTTVLEKLPRTFSGKANRIALAERIRDMAV